MTVEIYRSTDASAPVLTGQVGSLITLLDAVLINGYGSKAAAGWAKSFAATNKAVYRMPAAAGSPGESSRRYFRIDDDLTGTPYSAEVQMFDTMTGVTVYDGEYKVPKVGSGNIYIRKSITSNSTARPWTIVASERGFYCFFANGSTTYASTDASDFGAYFGDFISYIPGDVWNTIVMGDTTLSTSSSQSKFGASDSVGVFSGATGRFARSTAFGQALGSNISLTSRRLISNNIIGVASSSGVDYPDPVRGGMSMDRVELTESMNSKILLRGYLPGLWVTDARNPPGTFYDTFDGSGFFSGITFLIVPLYNASTAGRAYLELANTWW